MTDKLQDFRPAFTNLVRVLQDAVSRFTDRPLFGTLRGEEIAWTTYAQFASLVDAFRSGLQSLGVNRGDSVAVISNNRLEWAVGAHATYGLSARYVPMYEAQSDDDWKFILEDADAKVCLVANAAVEKRLQALRPNLPNLREVVNFEGSPEDPKSYAGLLAYGERHPEAAIVPDDSDLATLIYTSGTTGKPKGVKLSHFNLGSNVSALLSLAEVTQDDCGLAFLPWAHIFGGAVELNLTIATGSSTVICGDASQLLTYIAHTRPTVLFAVPRMWNMIYSGVQNAFAAHPAFQPAVNARNKQRRGETPTPEELQALEVAQKDVFPQALAMFGGRLRYACSGAAALSREVAEFMDTLGIQVYEGYGMTETGGCTTAQPYRQVRLGSVGKPIPGIRLELDKNVEEASGDDEGEIIVYGTGVMRGYHNLEEATKKTVTGDGGLRTGDIGRLDADGYLYITGRVKELYKLENGKYVAPAAVEKQVELSPFIAQCAVSGAAKPHNVAVIVPDMQAIGQWATAQGLQAQGERLLAEPRVKALIEREVDKANAELKGYERVQNFVLESEAMSTANGLLTASFKLRRREFGTRYADVLESLYPRPQSQQPPRASYIRELRPVTKTA